MVQKAAAIGAFATLSPVTRCELVNTSKPSCRAMAISVMPAASQATHRKSRRRRDRDVK
jgi:hypothetical protein